MLLGKPSVIKNKGREGEQKKSRGLYIYTKEDSVCSLGHMVQFELAGCKQWKIRPFQCGTLGGRHMWIFG